MYLAGYIFQTHAGSHTAHCVLHPKSRAFPSCVVQSSCFFMSLWIQVTAGVLIKLFNLLRHTVRKAVLAFVTDVAKCFLKAFWHDVIMSFQFPEQSAVPIS